MLALCVTRTCGVGGGVGAGVRKRHVYSYSDAAPNQMASMSAEQPYVTANCRACCLLNAACARLQPPESAGACVGTMAVNRAAGPFSVCGRCGVRPACVCGLGVRVRVRCVNTVPRAKCACGAQTPAAYQCGKPCVEQVCVRAKSEVKKCVQATVYDCRHSKMSTNDVQPVPP